MKAAWILAIVASFVVGTMLTGGMASAQQNENAVGFGLIADAINNLGGIIENKEINTEVTIPEDSISVTTPVEVIGVEGPAGQDGTSCTVSEDQSGDVVISCADGTSAVIPAGSDVNWSDVTGIPEGIADGIDNDILGTLSCSEGQIAKLSGGVWACSEDNEGTGGGTANDLDCTECVDSSEILNGAVREFEIDDNAVNGNHIIDGTITENDLFDNSIRSHHILDGTISSSDIADGTISSSDIADGTISSSDIADGTISSSDVGVLGSSNIANGAIGPHELDNSIIYQKDHFDQVDTGQISSISISCTSGDIAIGGGISDSATDDGDTGADLLQSYPIDDGNSWRTVAKNTHPGVNSIGHYVICLDVT